MRVVPVVAVLDPHARQVGADPPCGEEVRQIVRILARFGHRAPAQAFPVTGRTYWLWQYQQPSRM